MKFGKNCGKLRKIWRLKNLKFEYCRNILYVSKNGIVGEVENWILKNIYLKLYNIANIKFWKEERNWKNSKIKIKW